MQEAGMTWNRAWQEIVFDSKLNMIYINDLKSFRAEHGVRAFVWLSPSLPSFHLTSYDIKSFETTGLQHWCSSTLHQCMIQNRTLVECILIPSHCSSHPWKHDSKSCCVLPEAWPQIVPRIVMTKLLSGIESSNRPWLEIWRVSWLESSFLGFAVVVLVVAEFYWVVISNQINWMNSRVLVSLRLEIV
jgi:hypothetical protein